MASGWRLHWRLRRSDHEFLCVLDHPDGLLCIRTAHDEIETEYRKLGTNLLKKEVAQAEVERLLRPPDHEKPKGGA